MTLVVDASAVYAALVDYGATGEWARSIMLTSDLAAPHVMPVEVAAVLRRQAQRGRISAEMAALAHADMLELAVELYPYAPTATRVWDLRQNLTAFDAWYVALAEQLGASLVTVDRRMAAASGPLCRFYTPRAEESLKTGME